MTTGVNIADKLQALAGQGIDVFISQSGTLQARPVSRLTFAEQQWLGENAGAILAHLKASAAEPAVNVLPSEPWDARTAIVLMRDADGLVERLGVDGRVPAVSKAAATVVSAFASCDLDAVRFTISEFVALVRRLASERAAATAPCNRSASPAQVPALCGTAVTGNFTGTA
jgi:hypothetical protein